MDYRPEDRAWDDFYRSQGQGNRGQRAQDMSPVFRQAGSFYNENDPAMKARLAEGDRLQAGGQPTTAYSAGQQQMATPQPAFGGTYGQPTGQQRADQYKAALPNPNRVSSREWGQMPRDTQDFYRSAYADKGFSENDLEDTIQENNPQFAKRRTSYAAWQR